MQFTVKDIKRQFDAGTFSRGEGYAREGMVVDMLWKSGTIFAETEGSGGSTYRQAISLKEGRDGVHFEGSCSCPMSHNCKHVVAVLLTALDNGQQAGGGGESLSVATALWLSQVTLLRDVVKRDATLPATPNPNAQLVFLLVPDDYSDRLSLHIGKARNDKRGELVGVSLQDNIAQLLTAPWLARADAPLVRMVAALRAGGLNSFHPSGPLGFRLLTDLCAQGRLRFVPSTAKFKNAVLFPLQPAPRRDGVLEWEAVDDEEEMIALRWRFADDEEGLEFALATEPMCYVETGPDGLRLGELVLPPHLASVPPEALAALTMTVPVLEFHECAIVAERLAALGLERVLPLPAQLQMRERDDVVPVPVLVLDCEHQYVYGKLQEHDYALVNFEYDGLTIDDVDAPVLRRMTGDTVEIIKRDAQAERAAFDTLARLGFKAPPRHSPLAEEDWALQLPTPADWLAFSRRDLPRLREAGWKIEIEGNYRYEVFEAEEWYADLAEEGEAGDAWFSLELGILVDGTRHALLPLLVQMIRRAPMDYDAAALAAWNDEADLVVDLPNHTRVVLPAGRVKPILATLGELYFAERLGDTLRLPYLDAARLAELEHAAQLRWMGGERMRELGRKLHAFDGMRPVAPPAGLQAQLRPYQLTGLSWMQFLREYGFGGILADDMGLGKTIQTLAHILMEKEARRLDAPALVVAPTSLMGNWQAEAARFAPGLRVLLLHGKDRAAAFDQVPDADLVLTTYPLLGRDEAALRRHRYHLLILDEAQYIKNSRAKAAQVACLLDARHRLCLTGTPVQNHLGELWSQFHFLMPGLLGEEKTFKARYRKPIEQDGDVLRKDLLARRLKPFMLRRTKDKVATELPPKTEIVLPVDFGSAQRDLYESVRVAMDKRVRDEIDRKGAARSQIVILDALLKLRQVCCDPRLLHPDSDAGSAKLETLLELLDTLLSEGRKVLVFSQFTSMLALVEDALHARGIAYALLTGSTEDRAAPVAAFQGGAVPVFLVSLKAGGVGLNLTAADTVIHYDPWWNPATENQATDRAWRIGQDQPVFVYKLIARGTLEEKIQELQRRKAELAAAVLEPEGGLAEGVGADDLQALFAPG